MRDPLLLSLRDGHDTVPSRAGWDSRVATYIGTLLSAFLDTEKRFHNVVVGAYCYCMVDFHCKNSVVLSALFKTPALLVLIAVAMTVTRKTFHASKSFYGGTASSIMSPFSRIRSFALSMRGHVA